jgi:KDO2-lipid IV(A) lauroyltransferase
MIKKGLSRLGTFFLYLISLLPFWFLYLIADVLFIILYYITGYRRKVVEDNLRNSFPEKSEKERKLIEKKYFRYMADLIVESIKAISISATDAERRMKPTNPELVEHYLNNGKSIICVASHYGNWELGVLSFGLLTEKRRIGIYKPQSNEVFTDFFNNTRSRFGTTMISMKQTLRKLIEYKNEPTITLFGSDQTPVKHEINYFTTFLNQPTAVFLGAEKLSKMANSVVLFHQINFIKRGYYTYTFITLFENPGETKPYEITDAHVKYLEGIIREKPEYWLWSHRRWKFKPEDIQK